MSRYRDEQEDAIMLINHGVKAYGFASDQLQKFLADPNDIPSKNWACFFMQQTVELISKGCIQYYNRDFHKSHNIRLNKNIVIELADDHKELNEIAEVLNNLSPRTEASLYKWVNIARYKEVYVPKSYLKELDATIETLTLAAMRFLNKLEQ